MSLHWQGLCAYGTGMREKAGVSESVCVKERDRDKLK